MAGYTNITLGGVSFLVTSISARKETKTKKSIVGRVLSEIEIIGLKETQWRIRIDGQILGDTIEDLYTKRTELENLDDLLPHTYTDGLHDGIYFVVPGSIAFNDTEETAGTGTYLSYSLELVEE